MVSIDIDGVMFDYAKELDVNYQEGDIRLWVKGREDHGPVELLDLRPAQYEHGPHWHCIDLVTGEERWIPPYNVGRRMVAMEVIAWVARDDG